MGCGCRRGFFPGNTKIIRTVIAGLQAIPTRYTGALDAANSRGLAGRVGTVVIGEPSSPGWKFTGYLAYDGTARIPQGSTPSVKNSFDTLFPATAPDVTQPNSVLARLAQLTPGGYRR